MSTHLIKKNQVKEILYHLSANIMDILKWMMLSHCKRNFQLMVSFLLKK